jgi:hypothetical protein
VYESDCFPRPSVQGTLGFAAGATLPYRGLAGVLRGGSR